MQVYLLILVILFLLATICGYGVTILSLIGYLYTHDATPEYYQSQKQAVILFLIVSIALTVITIICFKARKKLKK